MSIGIRISGPLAGFAEGFGAELTRLGYAPASVRLQMKVFADLSDWLLNHGMVAADLRSSDMGRFLRDRRAAGYTRYASFKAVRLVLDYLQQLEVMPPQTEDAVLGPVDVVLDRFWRYLTVERLWRLPRPAAILIWCARSSKTASRLTVAPWILST